MTKKENTKLINLLFEVYRKGAEGVECNLDDSLKELLEAINVIHCCKSDSDQLKAFKNDETVALDGTLEVKIINIESKVLVKVIEDDTLMWVKKDRLKREYSF